MPSLLDSAAKAACECPHCHRVLNVRLDFANRAAICRSCKNRFRVPDREELIDVAASALIAESVDHEFRSRSRRTARTFERLRRVDAVAAATGSEVADPFSAMGDR